MRRRWMRATLLATVAAAVGLGVAYAAEETIESLTRKLWPPARVEAALQALDQQKQQGLISEQGYAQRKQMLEARRAGTYKPESLSVTDPPLNFIQNGGFELINKNSAPNRSRWLWWGGWSWGGDYVNLWEDRPEHVHSGKFSARIECKGEKGRIGISTPPLPVVPGATEYKLTLFAKGEGANELFVNFEEGVTGSLRDKLPAQWKELTVIGKPAGGNKNTYTLYLYVTGQGTIWLDDVSLVPVGGALDE